LSAEPTALELLELDLDARLLAVWLQAWAVESFDRETLVSCATGGI
jgi:hypothetical protein